MLEMPGKLQALLSQESPIYNRPGCFPLLHRCNPLHTEISAPQLCSPPPSLPLAPTPPLHLPPALIHASASPFFFLFLPSSHYCFLPPPPNYSPAPSSTPLSSCSFASLSTQKSLPPNPALLHPPPSLICHLPTKMYLLLSSPCLLLLPSLLFPPSIPPRSSPLCCPPSLIYPLPPTQIYLLPLFTPLFSCSLASTVSLCSPPFSFLLAPTPLHSFSSSSFISCTLLAPYTILHLPSLFFCPPSIYVSFLCLSFSALLPQKFLYCPHPPFFSPLIYSSIFLLPHSCSLPPLPPPFNFSNPLCFAAFFFLLSITAYSSISFSTAFFLPNNESPHLILLSSPLTSPTPVRSIRASSFLSFFCPPLINVLSLHPHFLLRSFLPTKFLSSLILSSSPLLSTYLLPYFLSLPLLLCASSFPPLSLFSPSPLLLPHSV